MEKKTITFDRFIRGMLVTLIVFAALYVTNYLSGVLLPFFIAWFFAYLLYPIVTFVQYRLHVRIRALAIMVTMILVIALLVGMTYLIVFPMVQQFKDFEGEATKYLNHVTRSNDITVWIQQWFKNHKYIIENFFTREEVIDTLKNTVPRLFSFISQTASILFSIIASLITVLYMFFILLDYESLTTNWIRIFPKKNHQFWLELIGDVKHELNNYVRGQALVSLCMAIMFYIGFTIIDFPMAISLSILIGILNLVPYLHTLSLIPATLLALIEAASTNQSFWVVFGSAVLVFIIVQIISDLFITPRVMSKAMRINPAIILLSLSVWGALLGFIGLIIALPLTTLIIAYWQRYVTKERRGKRELRGKPVTAKNSNE